MSLDVYLYVDEPVKRVRTGSGIFVRMNGAMVEVTREQWDQVHPGVEPIILDADEESDCVFSANITHNLGKMAAESCLYKPLWHPEAEGWTKAKDLIGPLKAGISLLEGDPEGFKKFNPSNGWGTYEQLLNFAIGYLGACQQWPEAVIRVSR